MTITVIEDGQLERQHLKDEAWLQACFELANLGTCIRRGTGCIIVDANNHVLSASYNGVPTKMGHCHGDRPCAGAGFASGQGLNECEAIHAEENALMLSSDISRAYTVYTTTSPCLDRCLRKLINTGAVRLVFANEYPDPDCKGKTLWESSREGRQWIHHRLLDRLWYENTSSDPLPSCCRESHT